MVKFIAKHNHPLSATPAKSRLHRSHSTVHQSKAIRRMACSLNSEGIEPSNIARVCNAIGGFSEQNVTIRQWGILLGERNNIDRECMEIVKYFQRRQEEDGSFYFPLDFSDDDMLRTVFWVDRSITELRTFSSVTF